MFYPENHECLQPGPQDGPENPCFWLLKEPQELEFSMAVQYLPVVTILAWSPMLWTLEPSVLIHNIGQRYLSGVVRGFDEVNGGWPLLKKKYAMSTK